MFNIIDKASSVKLYSNSFKYGKTVVLLLNQWVSEATGFPSKSGLASAFPGRKFYFAACAVLDPDGRTDKTKGFSNLVLQEALVRKVELDRFVGKQNKSRR